MKKIPLSDGSGNWFDIDSAKSWWAYVDAEEQVRREIEDPQEEKLYLTANGTFILYHWHWHMGDGLYHTINHERGAQWLIANGYQEELAKLELTPEERRLEL